MKVLATDSRMKKRGRIDTGLKKGLGLIWQGSSLDFETQSRPEGFFVEAFSGRVFLDFYVDGVLNEVFPVERTGFFKLKNVQSSGSAKKYSLYKRSEASFGHCVIESFELSGDGDLSTIEEPNRGIIEFYGDSITAGACNGDGLVDQYEDLSRHDHFNAYGAIAARSLKLEYRTISVSGIGICESWDPWTMPQIWDRQYCEVKSARFDFKILEPRYCVFNLGANDFGFTQSEGRPFPKDFFEAYQAMLRSVRIEYPHSKFILLLGGMNHYEESLDLRFAFDKVCAWATDEMDAASYLFKVRSETHPRKQVHQIMADEFCSFFNRVVI